MQKLCFTRQTDAEPIYFIIHDLAVMFFHPLDFTKFVSQGGIILQND
jgi:hypothetical protein